MLRDRLLAAALGLPMLFVLLWLNAFLRLRGSADDLPLLAVVALIAGASGWEVSGVVRRRYPHTSPWNGVYAALIIPFIVHAIRLSETLTGLAPVSSLGFLIDSLGATTMVMLLFLGVWSDVEHRGKDGLRENLVVVGGGLFLGATLSTLFLMQQTGLHEAAVMFVFMAVFALDTAAYFGGRRIGGPPLAPKISPKKTLSGAACGLAATVLLALLLSLGEGITGKHTLWWNLGGHLPVLQLMLLGACIGIFGQLGDLLESAFKRWGTVKDSGTIIPGHGGFLDRFDSLFLAAPAAYLLLGLFLHLFQ